MIPPILHMGNLGKISVLTYKFFFKVKIKVKSELKCDSSAILLFLTWNASRDLYSIFRLFYYYSLEGSCQIPNLNDIHILQGVGQKVKK